ncbi:MAG: hypothetical protein KIH69_023245 [Anaerolineae bacterium]|nr:hypothetical protein [Anaerolineae bacterium]
MIPVIHQQHKRLKELMIELSATLKSYSQGGYDFDSKVDVLIENLLQYYTEAEMSTNIAKINICKSDIATLKKGYHPETFLRIEKEKRKTRHIQIYRSLRQIECILEKDTTEINAKLNLAEDLIKQLILNALQLELINENTIKTRKDQDDLENIWQTIEKNPNLHIFQKKIILTSTYSDSIILLDIVLNNIF